MFLAICYPISKLTSYRITSTCTDLVLATLG